MPKKYIGYLTGLILLAAAGWYGYYKWQQGQQKVNLWTIVPDDAVFIVETNRHDKFVQELRRINLWENVSRLPYLLNLEENIALLDSAAARRVKLQQFLHRKKLLTSVHVVSKTDFDFVLYVPVSSVSEHRYIRNVVENIGKSPLFNSEETDYQGYVITTILNKQNQDAFSFFTYRNNVVLSQRLDLLQQVIRKLNRAKLDSPIKEFAKLNFLNSRSTYANVFVNYRNLTPFLNIFFKPEVLKDADYFAGLCSKSLLGLKIKGNNLFFQGNSRPETLAGSFSQRLKLQSSQPLGVQNITSKRTAVFIHFGGKQLAGLYENTETNQTAVLPDLSLYVDSLRQSIQNELALCYLPSAVDSVASDKMVLAYTPDPGKTNNYLQGLNQTTRARYPAERAGRYLVQEVGVPGLPELLFGKGFNGFNRCFTAQVDSFLLFAPSELVMRQFLQDIRDKIVWKNNSGKQKLKQTGLSAANFTLFLNFNNAWDILNQSVNEERKVGLLRYERLIKKFSQVSLQFARQGNQYNTRLSLQQQAAFIPASQPAPQFTIEHELNFPEPVITGLNLLPGNPSSKNELFVQDSLLVLHRLSTEGKISWSDSLNSKIAGNVIPIQLGNGAQPKYAFATRNRIYCLDQKGLDVDNFPFNLNDTIAIQGLTVLTRGNPGQQYFLVHDEPGNLYMFDTQGNQLPGWDPKETLGELATAPYYLQVKGREVLVLLLTNGYVYAVDQNGMNYPGFPINLKGSFSSPLLAQTGGNFRDSRFTALTEAGELITFNLSGQVESRLGFARPSRRTTFELIPENSGKSFLVARQDLGRVTLYDAKQKLVMEKSYVTSSRKLIQYFYFNPANVVYSVIERGPGKTYLYDINIKLISDQPIPNRLPIQLQYNPFLQQYLLHKVSGATFQQLVFQTQP